MSESKQMGTPSLHAGLPPLRASEGETTEQLQSEIDGVHEPSALDRANPADGPMQARRKRGRAAPEHPDAADPAGDTPDREGIEIDNAIERPR